MRIMGREGISMFISEADIQKEAEQMNYTKLQVASGN